MKYINWIIVLCIFSCAPSAPQQELDVQGHRGARGIMPENTIEGFLWAANLGVSTLEMDVVISADQQVVVSHEPFFSPEICLDSAGHSLAEDSLINLYELTYEQIQLVNCGSKPHPRFIDQKKMPTVKPLLIEVIDTIAAVGEKQLNYNIELKSKVETDDLFHPKPAVFVELVLELLQEKGISERVTIQSFDFRILKEVRRKYPNVKLALLIENDLPWLANVDSLGFLPTIYSPDYQLLSRSQVEDMHLAGMLVIPWTVNKTKDIERMLSWQVDGIISDYPNRVLELIKK